MSTETETPSTPPVETPVEQPKTETPAATLLDDTPEETATPPAKSGEEKPAESAPAKTLLDDDEETPPAEEKPAEETPNAPSEEDMEKFRSGIKAIDLGDGVEWSDDTLKAMTPSLMELTGGDPKKANNLVKAYADFVQGESRKQLEAAEAFNNGLIKECQSRFGADIKKVAKLAREGGRAIFGDDLWKALKSTPAFANNPDVLERLAEHGRRIAEDGGAVKPKDGEPTPESEDLLHRMYRNVKVG